MKFIIKTQFGSHVYGTNVPTSDYDIKGVYLPSAEDILLGRVKESIRGGTKADPTAKNEAGDIDEEFWSLQKYLKLLLEGNTPALDLLFTPERFHLEKASPVWNVIKENRHKLLTAQAKSFVGYTKTQADKYGTKGSRIAAVRKALEMLKIFDQDSKLFENEESLKSLVSNTEHCAFVMIPGPNKIDTMHLEVCNRKIPFFAKAGYAVGILQKIFDEYGHRAKMAEENKGIDWKALGHSVRVCNEAQELLLTGKITFPRPEKELLLKIRKGELPFQEVSLLIEEGLVKVEEAVKKSILPEKPDYQFAENLIKEVYSKIVKEYVQ